MYPGSLDPRKHLAATKLGSMNMGPANMDLWDVDTKNADHKNAGFQELMSVDLKDCIPVAWIP